MSSPIRETGPINAPMPGLLDFFSLKTFGANPTDVAQQILHVNDIRQFLIAGRRETFSFSPTPVVSGGVYTALGSVPNLETWILEGYGASINMAGSVLGGIFAVGFSSPANASGSFFGPNMSTAAGITLDSGLLFPMLMVMPGGTQFTLSQRSTTGAAFTAAPTPVINFTGLRVRS